jgi:prephenate dehydratase
MTEDERMTGRKKIVFQGEPGANSHIACREVYPDFEAIPCATFEDCFAAIEQGGADLGMIPVENSIAGRVADIHHLLPKSRLNIIGEYFLPIRHQLMGLKGATLAGLKSVQSHPQALGQCRENLRALGLEAVVGADTAGSARQISQQSDLTKGAIASRLAAEIYGLEILRQDVEDEKHNTTRFIILSPEELHAAPGVGPVMTTFVFNVRNVPAALYKALGGFATNAVNMTRLESYMVDGQFTATQFLADVEGHPDERGLHYALEELGFFADYRILGVYRQSPFRERMKDVEAARPRVKGM